jgi:hypothetical protein
MSTSIVDLQRSGKSDLVSRFETKSSAKVKKQPTLLKITISHILVNKRRKEIRCDILAQENELRQGSMYYLLT